MAGALTRQVGAVAVARLATAGAGVVTNALLGWLLAKDQAGQLQKAILVSQIAILGGSFGIQTSLYYFLPRVGEGRQRTLVGQGTGILALVGLAAAGVVFFGAGAIATWMGEPQAAALMRAAALAVAAVLPSAAADPLFIATGHARMAAVVAVGSSGLQVGVVAAALWLGWPLEFVFAGIAAASAVRLVAALGFSVAVLPPGRFLRWDGELARMQMAYVLPVGAVSVIDAFSSLLDRTLVARFYGASDYALYVFGATELPLISILVGSLTPVLLPRFSALLKEGDRLSVLKLFHKAAIRSGVLLFGLFFCFVWIAPQFLSALYSPKYAASAPYFRIYLLLQPVRIVAFMPLLFALGKRGLGAVGLGG